MDPPATHSWFALRKLSTIAGCPDSWTRFLGDLASFDLSQITQYFSGYDPNMPIPEPNRGPQLTEFVAGYAGPPPVDFLGGKIKVVAAIVYGDGIAIEWSVSQLPDLSWMP